MRICFENKAWTEITSIESGFALSGLINWIYCLLFLVGQDIRDRFTGAVEAFSRRNSPGHGLHGENSRHRSTDDTSKDVVSNFEPFAHFTLESLVS